MADKKKPRDLNLLAASIVDATTDGQGPQEEAEEVQKDPAAVELGRKGGQKGGKARAKKLTPEERSEIARIAARARWKKSDD